MATANVPQMATASRCRKDQFHHATIHLLTLLCPTGSTA
jgi:hypothetical protein